MAVDPNLVDVTTAAQMFSDIAKMEYQNRQYLIGIGEDRDMMGTSLEVPVIERIDLSDRGFTSGDIPITNIGSRSVLIEPSDFVAKTAVGDSNQTLFAYDKISAFSRAHILGAARQVDTVKISTMIAGTYTSGINQVDINAATTPQTGTGLNIQQLIDAQTLLENNGYDIRDNVYLIGNAKAIKNLFRDPRFTDWDYKPNRPISTEPVDQFEMLLGMSVRKLGGEGKNVIPTTGATENTSVYVMAGDALVNGYNKRLHSEVVNEPWNLRTSIVTGLTMGSALCYPNGIIKVDCDQIPTIS